MNIVFIASEMSPFAKTGGLADVCGSLPPALARQGHRVKVCVPKYKLTDLVVSRLTIVIDSFTVQLGTEEITGTVYGYDHEDGVQVLFIENDEFFKRDFLYGAPNGDYPDNDRRFIFFQRAVLAVLKQIKFRPDIIHCNDWQTGLIPVYLKTLYSDDLFYRGTKSFFTIHNLAYQGIFPRESFGLTGLNLTEFSVDKLEFFGKVNFLKGALVYADVITTVSERYAREIQLKEFGYGLDGVLRARAKSLFGVLNGIDPQEWNPETDIGITVNYSLEQLARKYINKGVLQKENDLAVNRDVPLIGMVTRLADQKGLDIVMPIMPQLAEMDVQFVLLGTGDERYNRKFIQLGEEYPEKFGINVVFDPKMAKRIYAGADMFLMPSRFEPCGLGQMIALRYGTVPIVRETGGLADTIVDFNPATGEGNGFVFSVYTREALLKTIRKAVEYYKNKELWHTIIANGARCDFSWDHAAEAYSKLYTLRRKSELAYA